MTTKQILTATVLLMIALLTGCSKETVKQKPAKPVKVKAVETHSALSDVRYSASIKPAAQVEVSFKVAATSTTSRVKKIRLVSGVTFRPATWSTRAQHSRACARAIMQRE